MNKKVLKAAFIAAIATVASINVFNAQKSEVLSDIAIANVEALADLEMNTEDCEYYRDAECGVAVVTPTGGYGEIYFDQRNIMVFL